jgi:hypothetical protein
MTGKLNEETYQSVRPVFNTIFESLKLEIEWESIQHCMVFLGCGDWRCELFVRVEYLCRYVLPKKTLERRQLTSRPPPALRAVSSSISVWLVQ